MARKQISHADSETIFTEDYVAFAGGDTKETGPPTQHGQEPTTDSDTESATMPGTPTLSGSEAEAEPATPSTNTPEENPPLSTLPPFKDILSSLQSQGHQGANLLAERSSSLGDTYPKNCVLYHFRDADQEGKVRSQRVHPKDDGTVYITSDKPGAVITNDSNSSIHVRHQGSDVRDLLVYSTGDGSNINVQSSGDNAVMYIKGNKQHIKATTHGNNSKMYVGGEQNDVSLSNNGHRVNMDFSAHDSTVSVANNGSHLQLNDSGMDSNLTWNNNGSYSTAISSGHYKDIKINNNGHSTTFDNTGKATQLRVNNNGSSMTLKNHDPDCSIRGANNGSLDIHQTGRTENVKLSNCGRYKLHSTAGQHLPTHQSAQGEKVKGKKVEGIEDVGEVNSWGGQSSGGANQGWSSGNITFGSNNLGGIQIDNVTSGPYGGFQVGYINGQPADAASIRRLFGNNSSFNRY